MRFAVVAIDWENRRATATRSDVLSTDV